MIKSKDFECTKNNYNREHANKLLNYFTRLNITTNTLSNCEIEEALAVTVQKTIELKQLATHLDLKNQHLIKALKMYKFAKLILFSGLILIAILFFSQSQASFPSKFLTISFVLHFAILYKINDRRFNRALLDKEDTFDYLILIQSTIKEASEALSKLEQNL